MSIPGSTRAALAPALVAVVLILMGDGQPALMAQTPAPTDPVDTIIAAFGQRSLVALAEAHGLQEEHDLIVRLIRDPRFADTASTIVIEWANALYQATIDRYIGGEELPLSDLRQAWRNTGFSPFAPWDAPVYEQFFVVVRDVNRARSPARRLRVVAADPPVDWTQSPEAIAATKARYPRDEHFQQVIEREVLARNAALEAPAARGSTPAPIIVARSPCRSSAASAGSREPGARYEGPAVRAVTPSGFGCAATMVCCLEAGGAGMVPSLPT